MEMQREWEASRSRERKRAKVISAQGEFDASKNGENSDENKNAIVLRYLDTMKEISSGEGNHHISTTSRFFKTC